MVKGGIQLGLLCTLHTVFLSHFYTHPPPPTLLCLAPPVAIRSLHCHYCLSTGRLLLIYYGFERKLRFWETQVILRTASVFSFSSSDSSVHSFGLS
jgi:hypothetical protein